MFRNHKSIASLSWLVVILLIACSNNQNRAVPYCEPGAKLCNRQDVVRCNDQGTEWIFDSTCPISCREGICLEEGEDGDIESEDISENDETENELYEIVDEETEDDPEAIESPDRDGFLDGDLGGSDYDDQTDKDRENDSLGEDETMEDEGIEEEGDAAESLSCSPDRFEEANTDYLNAASIEVPFLPETFSLCEVEKDWYTFTAPANTVIHAIADYPGYFGNMNLILYRSDFNADLYNYLDAVFNTPEHAEVMYNTAVQADFYLWVWGRDLPLNAYSLEVRLEGGEFLPPGDTCDDAVIVNVGTPYVGWTYGGADNLLLGCSDSFGPDTVHRFYWEFQGNATITVEADFDTVVAVWRSCTGAPADVEVGCQDEFYHEAPEVLRIRSLPVGSYYLWIDGAEVDEAGNYTLLIEEETP